MPDGRPPAVVEPPRDPGGAVRLAHFYTAYFGALGVYMPFWPVWLRSHGCTDVAGVLSAQIIARTIAGPLWAARADRTGRPRAVLRLLAFGSLAAVLLFPLGESLAWLYLCSVLFGLCYPPVGAILDSVTLGAAARHGFPFGRVRLFGSLAFLLANVGAGLLLGRPRAAGSDLPANAWLILVLVAAPLVATVAASFRLPPDTPAPVGVLPTPHGRGLWRRPFVWFLIGIGLVQGSHAAYYTFGSLHWLVAGHSPATVGVLWAEGVLAEVALFLLMRPLVAAVSPRALLLLGALGAVVRWTALAQTTALGWLFAVNWLHAGSFAASHVGAMLFIERTVPPTSRATAQALMGAANSGLFLVLGTQLAGQLQGPGGTMFLAMAAMAGLGGLCLFGCARTDAGAQAR